MPIITLEQTGDADVERGGDFSLFTRTADAELRERGLFIGESLKVIERAMVAGAVPRAMLLPEKLLEDTMPVIERALAADASTPIYVAPKALFKEITGYEVVRSALAVFERPSLPNATELLDSLGARRVAVLEDIGNSTNIGAIFRSVAALGVDPVVPRPAFPSRRSRVDGDGVPGSLDADRKRSVLGGGGDSAPSRPGVQGRGDGPVRRIYLA